jgi:hypothetical protein
VIVDSGVLGKIRPAPGGGLIVPARIGRAGVQVYKRPDGSTVRAYRPPEEVQKADFTGAPITVGHPAGGVSPETFTTHARGMVRTQAAALAVIDGQQWAEAELQVSAADVLDGVKTGKMSECSCAYDCVKDWTAGVTPDGEAYDVIFKDLVPNHVALGGAGFARAGRNAKVLTFDGETMKDVFSDTTLIADSADQAAPPDVSALAKLIADGNAALTAAKSEIETLTAKLAAAETAATAATASVPKLVADGVAAELAFRSKVAANLPKDFVADGKSRREILTAIMGKLDPKFVVTDAVTDSYLETYVDAASKYAAPHDYNADVQHADSAPAANDPARHITDSTKDLWRGPAQPQNVSNQLAAAIAKLGAK